MKQHLKLCILLVLFSTTTRCGSGLLLNSEESTSHGGISCGEIENASYTIDTVYNLVNDPKQLSMIGNKSAVVARPNYNDLYIANLETGTDSHLAGTGSAGYSGDGGLATAAQIQQATGGLRLDDGSYLISDSANHRIRRVDNSGNINTVIGDGTPSHITNTAGITARVNSPGPLVLSEDGQYVFFVDRSNNCIRRIRLSDYYVTDLAGTCGSSGYSDGNLGVALFNTPYGIARDRGMLYVADYFNHRVRVINIATGYTSTFAGGANGFNDGDTGSALFSFPEAVAVDHCGFVYVADRGNNRIRKIVNGNVVTAAGDGSSGYSGDGGDSTQAVVASPSGIGVVRDGTVYFSDSNNNVVRRLSIN